MDLAEIRPRLRQRRERIAERWALEGATVLIPAGLPIPIAGTDLFHDYHAHPEHLYLAGTQVPGSVLAFGPGEGWTLFVPEVPVEEQVWTGPGEPLESVAARSGVDDVRPIEAFAHWLERHRGTALALIGNDDLLARPDGYGVEDWRSLEVTPDPDLSARLSEVVAEERRVKDSWELELMRRAARASVAGHDLGIRVARPGMTERELQIEIEAEFFRHGAQRTAYGSIVGGGPDGAILHFAPTDRPFGEGELILVDAGAEVHGYASDVTRTYPVSGRFEGLQRDLYSLVYEVQSEAIGNTRPGVEYKDLHMTAALRIATGLRDAGILRGDPQDLVDQDAHALFFPHGLGHMLGLATHDAGGCLAGREKSERFGLKYLRTDLPLAPGHVVTIEPGIYFIEALLTDPERRERYREMVDWERVDSLRDFGGIRIEDDVLITEDGAEVLSGALPRAVDDVEALRQAGPGR